MNKIRKINIDEARYRFLQTEENLKDNIILLSVAGSRAYGTDIITSDTDLRGVAVERSECLLGLNTFEQFEDVETDTVVYGLKKFISLCLQCNPNVLELLGTDDSECTILTDEGRLLRKNASLFLSKRAIASFGNYATAQLRRLQNALVRGYVDSVESERHVLNRVNNQLEHLRQHFTALTGGNLNLYLDTSQKQGMETEIFMDINLTHFPLRDFKTIYSDLSTVVRDYSSLNHRNNKRDEPHLFKHAMHLLRLLATGKDILDGKGIVTYRTEERTLFLSIRNGDLSFDEIFKLVDIFAAQFQTAAERTKLPELPNADAVEALMLRIYRDRLLT